MCSRRLTSLSTGSLAGSLTQRETRSSYGSHHKANEQVHWSRLGTLRNQGGPPWKHGMQVNRHPARRLFSLSIYPFSFTTQRSGRWRMRKPTSVHGQLGMHAPAGSQLRSLSPPVASSARCLFKISPENFIGHQLRTLIGAMRASIFFVSTGQPKDSNACFSWKFTMYGK